MKKTLLSLVLALALVPAPAAAHANAGALDPTFAQDGRLTIASPGKVFSFRYTQEPERARMAMDLLPTGAIAATDGVSVFVRARDGRPQAHFGQSGRVRIEPPLGWEFEPADLAVDAAGRILVAGTLVSLSTSARFGDSSYEGVVSRAREGAIFRYLPDGQPDSEFGVGGVLMSEFGQQPPAEELRNGVSVRPSMAIVGLSGLALAPDGDILVSGYSAAGADFGCIVGATVGAMNRAFFARLLPNGDPDPAFGSGGVVTEGLVERASAPAIGPTERIAFEGNSGGYCFPRGSARTGKLIALFGDGRFDPGFGSEGGVPHQRLPEVSAIAFDSRGRLLVLGSRWERVKSGADFAPRWRVRRLLASGRPDSSFGRKGIASPKLPTGARLDDMTLDGRGRIVLAGSVIATGTKKPSRFLLTRLRGDGRREHGFGRAGWTATAFPGGAVGLEVELAPRGRLLVGGVLGDPRGLQTRGLAFARYESR